MVKARKSKKSYAVVDENVLNSNDMKSTVPPRVLRHFFGRWMQLIGNKLNLSQWSAMK